MKRDQQIFDLIQDEHERQVYGIELIRVIRRRGRAAPRAALLRRVLGVRQRVRLRRRHRGQQRHDGGGHVGFVPRAVPVTLPAIRGCFEPAPARRDSVFVARPRRRGGPSKVLMETESVDAWIVEV